MISLRASCRFKLNWSNRKWYTLQNTLTDLTTKKNKVIPCTCEELLAGWDSRRKGLIILLKWKCFPYALYSYMGILMKNLCRKEELCHLDLGVVCLHLSSDVA